MKFNKTVAKEIAQNQIDYLIDCILGNQDRDYNLDDEIEKIEQNFEDDLIDKGINPTTYKIKVINNY